MSFTRRGTNRCTVIVTSGVNSPKGPLSRHCPRCDVGPGWSCLRRVAKWKDNEGYLKPMTTFHRER